MKLFVYNKRLQAVNFYGLLKRVYQYEPIIDTITQFFKPIRKVEKEPMTQINAVRLVQRAYKQYRKRMEEKEERESKRRREYRNKEMEYKIYSPQEMIDVIRDKLRHTKEDPRKMIKAYNLVENDEVDLKTLTTIL